MDQYPTGFNHSPELDWVIAGLGGTTEGPEQEFLCRPSIDDPQLLIPLRPRRAAAAATRKFHDGKSTKERAEGLAAQVLGRTGFLHHAPGETVTLPPFKLVKRLERELGEAELVCSVSLGPRRRNRKPVVQLIRPDGIVVGFAKIGWSDLSRELSANEARWLRRVENKLPEGVRAPTVLFHIPAESWPENLEVVVTGALHVSATSGRTAPLDADLALAIASIWPGGSANVGSLDAIGQWRDAGLDAQVNLDALVQRHGDSIVELGMWHGDLTPWNTSSSGGRLLIWDWEFADADRPIGFDLLHMAFEHVRRAKDGGEAAAVSQVVRDASKILAPAGGPVDAIVDLYLCELLARERRLAGQGWDPSHLGALEPHLIDALAHRLR